MINANAVSNDSIVMAAAVARYNIKHFCKRLAEETDEIKRQTIFKLVAEEKAKLDALMDHLADMRLND
jgi:hypothetical protein